MKFIFVTPRYGAELTTGPEHACRLLAEQVSQRHEVEVLTTCARDARTWKNDTSEGVDRVRGALVRRFAVSQAHDPAAFAQLTDRLRVGAHGRGDEIEWVRRAGPLAPGLIEHLKRQRHVDAVVFFGLTNPLTLHGLPEVAERAVLFPYLQLRPWLRFGLFAELIATARAVGYISAAERRLMRAYLRVAPAHEDIVGIGVDPSPEWSYPRHQQDPADVLVDEDARPIETDEPEAEDPLSGRGVPFRRRHRLYGRLAVYGGRVEPDNGCEEMLEYFDTFAQESAEPALVLMGVKMMKVPEEPYLRLAGVLPERQRTLAYESADVTIVPAPDDLVSQPLLESLAVGTPVLASARNEAAVEHCRRAQGGLYYRDRDEFVEALRLLTANNRLRERLGENGRAYVKQHYRWDAVLTRFERLVARGRR